MSYDIRFGVKVAGAPEDCYAVIGEPEYHSPTYNLGKIFRACTGWDYKQGEWYPMKEVRPKILRGLAELTKHPGKYRKYEPDNGWGTIESAKLALNSIAEYFRDGNPGGLSWSWNSDIPLDCIYMCW